MLNANRGHTQHNQDIKCGLSDTLSVTEQWCSKGDETV